jgi:hypothetical protein
MGGDTWCDWCGCSCCSWRRQQNRNAPIRSKSPSTSSTSGRSGRDGGTRTRASVGISTTRSRSRYARFASPWAHAAGAVLVVRADARGPGTRNRRTAGAPSTGWRWARLRPWRALGGLCEKRGRIEARRSPGVPAPSGRAPTGPRSRAEAPQVTQRPLRARRGRGQAQRGPDLRRPCGPPHAGPSALYGLTPAHSSICGEALAVGRSEAWTALRPMAASRSTDRPPLASTRTSRTAADPMAKHPRMSDFRTQAGSNVHPSRSRAHRRGQRRAK